MSELAKPSSTVDGTHRNVFAPFAAIGLVAIAALLRAYQTMRPEDRRVAEALLLLGVGSVLDLSGRTVMKQDFMLKRPEKPVQPEARPDAQVVMADMVAVARRPEFRP